MSWLTDLEAQTLGLSSGRSLMVGVVVVVSKCGRDHTGSQEARAEVKDQLISKTLAQRASLCSLTIVCPKVRLLVTSD